MAKNDDGKGLSPQDQLKQYREQLRYLKLQTKNLKQQQIIWNNEKKQMKKEMKEMREEEKRRREELQENEEEKKERKEEKTFRRELSDFMEDTLGELMSVSNLMNAFNMNALEDAIVNGASDSLNEVSRDFAKLNNVNSKWLVEQVIKINEDNVYDPDQLINELSELNTDIIEGMGTHLANMVGGLGLNGESIDKLYYKFGADVTKSVADSLSVLNTTQSDWANSLTDKANEYFDSLAEISNLADLYFKDDGSKKAFSDYFISAKSWLDTNSIEGLDLESVIQDVLAQDEQELAEVSPALLEVQRLLKAGNPEGIAQLLRSMEADANLNNQLSNQLYGVNSDVLKQIQEANSENPNLFGQIYQEISNAEGNLNSTFQEQIANNTLWYEKLGNKLKQSEIVRWVSDIGEAIGPGASTMIGTFMGQLIPEIGKPILAKLGSILGASGSSTGLAGVISALGPLALLATFFSMLGIKQATDMHKTYTNMTPEQQQQYQDEHVQNYVDPLDPFTNTNNNNNNTNTVTTPNDISGSFRSGLNYVPRDGFIAELHQGEMVLNKQRANDYRANMNAGISAQLASGFSALATQAAVDRQSAYNSFRPEVSIDNTLTNNDPSAPQSNYQITGGDYAEDTWKFLRGLGYSKQATAGILGNMEQESGVNPTRIQGNGKGPAAGICQWENYNTKSKRWKGMADYASSKGKPWTDLQSQLEWLDMEMQGKDSTTLTYLKKFVGGYSQFKALTDVDKATKVFEDSFERAGKPNMPRRYAAAKQYYDKFNAYEQGTPFVPNDQIALLHKGEMVVPADKNPNNNKVNKVTQTTNVNNKSTDKLIKDGILAILAKLDEIKVNTKSNSTRDSSVNKSFKSLYDNL